MPISFPLAPANLDEYTFDGRAWAFNGVGWVPKPVAGVQEEVPYVPPAGDAVHLVFPNH